MLTVGTGIEVQSKSLVEDRVRGVGLGFERVNNPSDRNILAEVARMKKKVHPNRPEAE